MTTLRRFLSRIALASALAVGIACIGDTVGAEMLQSSTLMTRVYPEVVAKTLIPNSSQSLRLNPDANGANGDAIQNNGSLRAVDYAEILGRQFAHETERRKYDLTDMEAQALVSDITFRARSIGAVPLFGYHRHEDDMDLLADYQEDVLREAADEAIQEIGWLNNLENRIQSLFRYEIYQEGAREREYSNREFEWEDRKEGLRQQETTVLQSQPSRHRPYDAHYGLSLLNLRASNGSFVEAPSAYVRWEKLRFVDKLKLNVQPMEEVSVSLRSSINKRWYWQNKALLDEDFDPRMRFSVTRRNETRRNRITLFTEFGEHGRVGVMFGALL